MILYLTKLNTLVLNLNFPHRLGLSYKQPQSLITELIVTRFLPATETEHRPAVNGGGHNLFLIWCAQQAKYGYMYLLVVMAHHTLSESKNEPL